MGGAIFTHSDHVSGSETEAVGVVRVGVALHRLDVHCKTGLYNIHTQRGRAEIRRDQFINIIITLICTNRKRKPLDT